MREVKYTEFKKSVKDQASDVVEQMNRRAPRRRPRNPVETEILAQLASTAWDKAIATGRLQKEGVRRYSLNVNVR